MRAACKKQAASWPLQLHDQRTAQRHCCMLANHVAINEHRCRCGGCEQAPVDAQLC